jgi:hypothetical protein
MQDSNINSICYLLEIASLIGKFCDHKNEGNTYSETSLGLQWSTRRYIAGDRTLQ